MWHEICREYKSIGQTETGHDRFHLPFFLPAFRRFGSGVHAIFIAPRRSIRKQRNGVYII